VFVVEFSPSDRDPLSDCVSLWDAVTHFVALSVTVWLPETVRERMGLIESEMVWESVFGSVGEGDRESDS